VNLVGDDRDLGAVDVTPIEQNTANAAESPAALAASRTS
jgi:hypothetical protein